MATSKTTTSKSTKTKSKSTKKKGNPSIKTFSSAVKYLLNQTDFERMRVVQYDEETFKLDRMRDLLNALGNPQDAVSMIHVAGTVGKGSTVAMLSSMLRGNGYTVGEYTSPHLETIRERVVVNDEMIEEDAFVALLSEVVSAADSKKIKPTFFEFMTAIAFKYFADEAVDLAIIEAGLGGRLDSTNVIHPILTLITEIDLDHTHILGDSLEEIAKEKAGIFKKGVPALSASPTPEVAEVLKGCAEQKLTTIQVIDDDIEFSARFGGGPDGKQHTRICLITEETNYMHIPVPLKGEHQAKNCALALAAVNQLEKMNYAIDELSTYNSLAQTNVEGRM